MSASPFRIIVTPRGSDGFHSRDHDHDAQILADIIRTAVDAQYGEDAEVQQIRHNKPPSRFHAIPAEIDTFLREHFAEDTLLRYQQAIGNRAVEEAARDIRMETNSLKAHGVLEHDRYRPCRDAADQIDPLKGGGHWPSVLVSFGSKCCPTCGGTGDCHQIGCQGGES